jgi:hypothetical protein
LIDHRLDSAGSDYRWVSRQHLRRREEHSLPVDHLDLDQAYSFCKKPKKPNSQAGAKAIAPDAVSVPFVSESA